MEKSKKWMIVSMIITLACLALGLTCAILRGFDLVTALIFGVIVVLSILVSIGLWSGLVKERAKKESELKK